MTASAPGRSAVERARRGFDRVHGGAPTLVVRSPGRVNLVGDHTDYSGGLALPMAIDRELVLVARPRDDRRARLWSEVDEAVHDRSLDEAAPPERWDGWTVYVQGVLRAARGTVAPPGFDLAIASDLPSGAGLSSSAALEVGVAHLATSLAGVPHDPGRAAEWGRAAENDWVGVATGILDQVTVAQARAGHALLLDCATTSWEHVPVPPDLAVVVLDTGARRSLVGSAYDDRRRECEQAVEALGVSSLRELGPDDLDRVERLPGVLAARARHVVTENDRVRTVAAALAGGDHATLGRALAASHASLRDDYEVSGPELDTMADLANATTGVVGARMTGGGFAGAVVAVAVAGRVDLADLVDRYRRRHPLPARALVVHPVDATGPLPG